jgi:hypothetical protein
LLLAEESDNHLEILDDQVTDIRASVGRRPAVLSVNVQGMELWMSVASLSDTLQGVKHDVEHPVPNHYDSATRDIADNAARDAQVARERGIDLDAIQSQFAGRSPTACSLFVIVDAVCSSSSFLELYQLCSLHVGCLVFPSYQTCGCSVRL